MPILAIFFVKFGYKAFWNLATLFCFNIRQYGRQILYFKLHVDGRKFHYQRPHVVYRWTRPRVGKHFLRRATLKISLLPRAACSYYIYNRFENLKSFTWDTTK